MLKSMAIGTLGRDAEVRDTKNPDLKIISFSIAVNEKKKQPNGQYADETTWINCALFRKPQQTGVAQYMKKGTKVYIEGKPSAGHYEKNGNIVDQLSFTVFNIELLSSKNDSGNGNYQSQQAPPPPANSGNNQQNLNSDDDLPF